MKNYRGTIKDIAQKLHVTPLLATGLVNYLAAKGEITDVGTLKRAGMKGKSPTIWEFTKPVTIGEELFDEVALNEPVAEEVPEEVAA